MLRTLFTRPLDALKLRIVAAIEEVTQQMLENTWREIECRLDKLRATKGAHVEAVLHSAILVLYVINLFQCTFIFLKHFYFVISGLKIIGHGNPDNNLESLCDKALSLYGSTALWTLVAFSVS
jgi:hypothetical protein